MENRTRITFFDIDWGTLANDFNADRQIDSLEEQVRISLDLDYWDTVSLTIAALTALLDNFFEKWIALEEHIHHQHLKIYYLLRDNKALNLNRDYFAKYHHLWEPPVTKTNRLIRKLAQTSMKTIATAKDLVNCISITWFNKSDEYIWMQFILRDNTIVREAIHKFTEKFNITLYLE